MQNAAEYERVKCDQMAPSPGASSPATEQPPQERARRSSVDTNTQLLDSRVVLNHTEMPSLFQLMLALRRMSASMECPRT